MFEFMTKYIINEKGIVVCIISDKTNNRVNKAIETYNKVLEEVE